MPVLIYPNIMLIDLSVWLIVVCGLIKKSPGKVKVDVGKLKIFKLKKFIGACLVILTLE